MHEVARAARAVLSPQTEAFDIISLERTFTLRANEGFVERFAAPLVTAISEAAPRVRLRFAPKPEKNAGPLREGQIDLEIGVLGASAPEIRAYLLFRDDFMGVARTGHPLLTEAMTAERYAACKHVVASRGGSFAGPVDDALERIDLQRMVSAVVPGFSDALRVAADSDLVALVPRSCLDGNGQLPGGLRPFELPVSTPAISIFAMWHPRMDVDAAHHWLREAVVSICRRYVALDKQPATVRPLRRKRAQVRLGRHQSPIHPATRPPAAQTTASVRSRRSTTLWRTTVFGRRSPKVR